MRILPRKLYSGMTNLPATCRLFWSRGKIEGKENKGWGFLFLVFFGVNKKETELCVLVSSKQTIGILLQNTLIHKGRTHVSSVVPTIVGTLS